MININRNLKQYQLSTLECHSAVAMADFRAMVGLWFHQPSVNGPRFNALHELHGQCHNGLTKIRLRTKFILLHQSEVHRKA